MFERVGRHADPEGCARNLLAAALLGSVVVCSGAMAAAEWLTWLALRFLWELLRALLWSTLDLALPPFAVLEPPELTVVAVALDAPMVWDERWDEPLPDRPLPTLVPPEPEPLRIAQDVVQEEIVHSALLLKIIGTRGDDAGVIANLWSDDENSLGDVDMALSTASGIGVGEGTDNALMGSGRGIGGLGRGGGGSDLGGLVGVRVDHTPRAARLVHAAELQWPTEDVGRCTVEVTVDEDGAGVVHQWITCDPAVRPAAEVAIAGSTFRPPEHGGEPVVTVVFRR